MKRKLISMFLIIVLLQPLYSFVFAQNITNEENIQNKLVCLTLLITYGRV